MAAISLTVAAPILLSTYAQSLPETSKSRLFVENMIAESDVLRACPFLPAYMGKREFMDISSLPTVGFRNINQAAPEATGTFNLREEDTFFIDQYIRVDRAAIDRLGPSAKPKQEKLTTVALSQMFSTNFIKGDGKATPGTPNGLQSRCLNDVNSGAAIPNLLYNSVAAGGAPLSLANLDKLYWTVNKPSHWIFPRGMMPYLDIVARNSTIVNQTIDFKQDDFGRRIVSYKGLPILFGYEPDDSPDMIPFTEVGVGGGPAQCASCYCVSLRDGGLYAIEQTPLTVRDEGLLPGLPFESSHVKWDWGIAREHPKAISRLSSVNVQAGITA